MPNFYVCLRDLAFAGRDTDLAEDFTGLQGSGQHFNEEVSGFDHAVAFGAGGDNFCIEREDGGRPVSCAYAAPAEFFLGPFLMSCQMTSGLMGISMWRTP